MKIGIDIGSTTIKGVVLDQYNQIIYSSYERHYSHILDKLIELIETIRSKVNLSDEVELALSGSAGMGIAEKCGIPFIQEVYATKVAAETLLPGTDAIIELGGEDAKILFLTHGMEVRMNGSCAGGTGAFIDQMSTLLNVSLEEMNRLAAQAEKIYTIASRCGVFAKTDIQPLLNQGARKSDIAASIFGAVVNQTIAGLAQGRRIEGNVVYLGGTISFMPELKKCFDKSLGLVGNCPENALYYVALGTAYAAHEVINLDQIESQLKQYATVGNYAFNPPLFKDEEEYKIFKERHQKAELKTAQFENYTGKVHIGIDAGSTTLKTVIINEEGELLAKDYRSNSGNPIPLIEKFLEDLYEKHPQIVIGSSTVTGYGEELIKEAFNIDYGVVETVAHFTGAKKFRPDVDFIIDIGGQDIKCFKVEDGAISDIFLNEACSSGCGSFLQTFANALGYSIEDFAKLGIFADKPVDLGSRCTVFMNSSVKQAQKDGASIENISAGLSISVVKNALYKVIRATTPSQLGRHIVVQGGTFHNEAVLRAFERELGVEVVRPNIAGLMGAYGAALYGLEKSKNTSKETSILTLEGLKNFQHDVKNVICGLCHNACQLTVNSFGSERKYISGNRCERPLTKKSREDSLNLYAYTLDLLKSYKSEKGRRGTIGIPMGLNLYELYPFWNAFFTALEFEVVTSPASNRKLYINGQHTIPSDTVCFPAKLIHGHVQALIDAGVKTIFYPCMSYNIDEGLGDNHYNCPVVAYYPEVIGANMSELEKIKFINDYVGIHRPKDFPHKMTKILEKYFEGISLAEVKKASKIAYKAYEEHLGKIRQKGKEIIEKAQQDEKPIIVLAGRPYHIDPEINHGIDQLIAGFGVAVISEESISHLQSPFKTKVLNQWTYHSRLYAAAKYIGDKKNMNLVQLVSFGCGVDAITTDEVKEILQQAGKLYTQIKIDEITNLGAVKIRLRSLFAAIDQMEGNICQTQVEKQ